MILKFLFIFSNFYFIPHNMQLNSASSAKIVQKIRKKANKTIYEYGLIKPNDKILLGLSGGKDSLTMLDILVALRNKLPFQFEVKAVHIQSKAIPYSSDLQFLQNFCAERNVYFESRTVDYSIETDDRNNPCYLCAVHRRNALFGICSEWGMNKIALGHNLTDSIGTMLMNMMFHGETSAIPPSLTMFGGEVLLIRPLISITEEEVKKYISARGFEIKTKNCEFAESTSRTKVNALIQQMENIYPDAQQNIRKSMSNILSEYLIGAPLNQSAQ